MAAMPKRVHPAILLATLGLGVPLLVPAAATAANLSADTPLLPFGQVPLGNHDEEAVTLTNEVIEEGEETKIETTAIEGADASQFEIAELGTSCEPQLPLYEEETCAINVAFRPTSTGAKEATLVVESDANLSPIEVTLQGEGIAPGLSVTPSPFDFGSVQAGSKSAQRTFTVKNAGSDVAVLGAVGLAGSEPGQFKVESDACSSKSLNVGAECSVGVVFAPTSAGEKSATLELPSNAPDSPAAVALSGTAPSPPRPVQAVAPARPSNAFSFGKVIFNRRRGIASLPVRVPGPGSLLLGGKGLITRRGPGSALVLGGAGTARLAIVAAGRKEAALDRTGRARVVARVTYVPAGGDPSTKTKKIGLIKRR
jgi:Cep192 domain 4